MPPSTLCNYIRRKEAIQFMYDGALRTVEPHLLGLDASGDLTLSAWQTDGPTPDGWRDFWVEKMQNTAPTGQTFKAARPGYNRNDTTIKTIICRLVGVGTPQPPKLGPKPRERKPREEKRPRQLPRRNRRTPKERPSAPRGRGRRR